VRIILDSRKIEDYGIGVYLRHLFTGLVDSGFFDFRILHLKGTTYLSAPGKSFIEVSSKNYNFKEHLEVPAKIKRFKDFYYFSPHYVCPLFLKNRLIVTIHDLIHFKFPHLFRPAAKVELGKFFMRQVKKRAEIIFVVSETTKEDLIDTFGFDDSRIQVIYNGISDLFFNKPKSPSPLKFSYLLYIGNLKPHKNLNRLLKAFSVVKHQYPDLKLVLVGIRQGKSLLNKLQDLKLKERVVLMEYLPEDKLIQYIDGAEFLVFPSLYEGFGFPPLEAMARRKAVISSPGGSLKEILGENALFFDPESYEELSEKIVFFLENEALRKEYQAKGHRRSLFFRWEKAVDKYINVLKGIS